MTISTALILGISPKRAARFSFILAIPVISGATLITFIETNDYSQILNLPGFVGLLTSFFVGYVSLRWLLKWIESGKLIFIWLVLHNYWIDNNKFLIMEIVNVIFLLYLTFCYL